MFNLSPGMETFYLGSSPLPMQLFSKSPRIRALESYVVYTAYGMLGLMSSIYRYSRTRSGGEGFARPGCCGQLTISLGPPSFFEEEGSMASPFGRLRAGSAPTFLKAIPRQVEFIVCRTWVWALPCGGRPQTPGLRHLLRRQLNEALDAMP